MNGKRVSLVLGAGGARGLAHIGVIRCLEERGYRIRYVAGSSMGALIGGIYAAGKLDVYADWVGELQRGDIVRLLDWSFGPGSLFKGARIIRVLEELIGNHNIEDLPVGFTAVATDLSSEREIWLNRGLLFDAIRASIAIPGVFAPVEIGGRLLVDGSVVNPVPIAPTLNDDSEITIAVRLDGRPGPVTNCADEAEARRPVAGYREAIARFLDGLLHGERNAGAARDPGALELVMRSMDVMQSQIGRLKLAAYSPDITIEIPRNACGFFDFHHAREMIAFGRQRAGESLDGASPDREA